MKTIAPELESAWWVLRIGFGVGPLVVGLDKFFHLIANWSMYLSPLAERFMPVPASVFMRAVGVGEMLIGLAVLTRWTRSGAYAAMVWLLCIAANLVSSGYFYDIALRDVELALGAFALARLSEHRQKARADRNADEARRQT